MVDMKHERAAMAATMKSVTLTKAAPELERLEVKVFLAEGYCQTFDVGDLDDQWHSVEEHPGFNGELTVTCRRFHPDPEGQARQPWERDVAEVRVVRFPKGAWLGSERAEVWAAPRVPEPSPLRVRMPVLSKKSAFLSELSTYVGQLRGGVTVTLEGHVVGHTLPCTAIVLDEWLFVDAEITDPHVARLLKGTEVSFARLLLRANVPDGPDFVRDGPITVEGVAFEREMRPSAFPDRKPVIVI